MVILLNNFFVDYPTKFFYNLYDTPTFTYLFCQKSDILIERVVDVKEIK